MFALGNVIYFHTEDNDIPVTFSVSALLVKIAQLECYDVLLFKGAS